MAHGFFEPEERAERSRGGRLVVFEAAAAVFTRWVSTSSAQSNGVGVRFVGGRTSVCASCVVFSSLVFSLFSSLVLTFLFRSSSMFNTSRGNGMPSSFGHSWSRRREFSSICATVMVMGSHQ